MVDNLCIFRTWHQTLLKWFNNFGFSLSDNKSAKHGQLLSNQYKLEYNVFYAKHFYKALHKLCCIN